MRQIAEGLGVSTGKLYHYFPSKETIFKQLVQELLEKDISTFLSQAPNGQTLKERLQAVTDFALQNTHYYYQQFLLWADFIQQTRETPNATHDLRNVWDRGRDALTDYLQISNPALIDFIMIYMDGLFVQCMYGRGTQDASWFRQQSQLMIQMVIQYEQHSHQA